VLQSASSWARASQLLLLVLLVNAPFWILSTHAFVSRAVISLDSLLVVILLERSRSLGLVALLASWLADIAVSAAMTYHFRTPTEFIQSATYAGSIHWQAFATSAVLMAALPFVVVLATLVLLPRTRVGVWPVLAAIGSLILVDATNGSSALSQRDVRAVPANLAGSSWHSLARSTLEPPHDPRLFPVSGGMAEAGKYLKPALASDASVLYVIVESFGVHKDVRVRQWLQDQIFTTRLAERYAFASEAVASRGGTTLGELRRQCGLYGSFHNLVNGKGVDCLPGSFARAGWTTVGMHGFSENMFSRRSWWPAMGLQELHFAEDLSTSVDRRCGAAFRGVCDEDLLRLAVSRTQRPRTYVYALTLNSHLPMAGIAVSQELRRICAEAELGDGVCTLLAHVALVLQALSRQLAEQQSLPYVLVAGDHPPPFFDTQSRDQFEREVVPLFALSPKTSPATGGTQPGSAP
jgi:hypothetical protein